MLRIICLLMGCMLWVTPALAQNALNPPLTGEMYRLEIFSKPIRVPEILLSSRATGLKYLSDYKGKIILLNIWATWCPPCVSEMPTLNALQEALGDDKLVVIPVSLDKDMDVVKKFMQERKLDKLVPYIETNGDIERLEAMKDVDGVPVTLILNQDMEAVARFQGDADWNGKEARAMIDYMIAHVKPGGSSADDGPPGMKALRSLYQ